jgi:hypothetical protein
MMTLRFGTDTGCFSGRATLSGVVKPSIAAILFRAVGNSGEKQPVLLDLSSEAGGSR